MHYRVGHPAPIQYSANALHYLCHSLYRMARGETLLPPPPLLDERWLTDLWWIDRTEEKDDEMKSNDIPDDFLDSFGVEVG